MQNDVVSVVDHRASSKLVNLRFLIWALVRRYQLYRKLGMTQSRAEMWKFLTLPGLELRPSVFQPVAFFLSEKLSLVTDYVTATK
jgi:hypothetical protein